MSCDEDISFEEEDDEEWGSASPTGSAIMIGGWDVLFLNANL